MLKLSRLIAVAAFGMLLSLGTWAEGEADHPIQPVSNPVYAETAVPQTLVKMSYLYQRFPKQVTLSGGSHAPLDGEAQLFALQLEYAFNDSLSLVANKDGYAILDPGETLNHDEGFADLSLGLKWAFWRNESTTVALRGTVELPIGDDDVFQGNGDGNFSPALLATWEGPSSQFNGVAGLILPFDDSDESTMSYVSLGGYCKALGAFQPLVEVNWFRVLSAGDGEATFDDGQGGSLVPSAGGFEGGDLFNFGAKNANENRDFVSLAMGFRYDICSNTSLGLTYELPLTEEDDSLMRDRITATLTVHF